MWESGACARHLRSAKRRFVMSPSIRYEVTLWIGQCCGLTKLAKGASRSEPSCPLEVSLSVRLHVPSRIQGGGAERYHP